MTESQRQLEDKIVNVHKEQEKCRQKLSEDITQAEAELEKSINGILKEAALHRDPCRLSEIILEEERQMQNLLALRLEEYQSLRKADVLSQYDINDVLFTSVSCFVCFYSGAMEKQFEESFSSHMSSTKKLMVNTLVEYRFLFKYHFFCFIFPFKLVQLLIVITSRMKILKKP